MNEANRSGMSTAELLVTTWQVWRSHAKMFVPLMGIPIATLLLLALIVNYVIAPHPEGTPLREVWLGTGFLQKVAVFVAFLGSFAMEYRALAASVTGSPVKNRVHMLPTRFSWNARPAAAAKRPS